MASVIQAPAIRRVIVGAEPCGDARQRRIAQRLDNRHRQGGNSVRVGSGAARKQIAGNHLWILHSLLEALNHRAAGIHAVKHLPPMRGGLFGDAGGDAAPGRIGIAAVVAQRLIELDQPAKHLPESLLDRPGRQIAAVGGAVDLIARRAAGGQVLRPPSASRRR